MNKSHIKHAVCFIKYKILYLIQMDMPLIHQVKQTSRSAFQGIVGREPYPVAEKAMEILNRLLHLGVTRFRSLFRGSRSRSEVVATFLAVLELCKARRLRLAGTAEDCTVTSTGESGPEEVTAPSNGAE